MTALRVAYNLKRWPPGSEFRRAASDVCGEVRVQPRGTVIILGELADRRPLLLPGSAVVALEVVGDDLVLVDDPHIAQLRELLAISAGEIRGVRVAPGRWRFPLREFAGGRTVRTSLGWVAVKLRGGSASP